MSPLSTTPLLAFAITIVLHLFARRLFPQWNLLDFPKRYGLSRSPLPYPTGIIAVLTFLAFFPFLEPITQRGVGLIIAIVILGITCFIDDRRPIPALVRLLIQFLCALIIFATGDCLGSRVCSVTNPFEGFIGGPIIELNGAFPILSVIVTIVWLMLTINALNWFDGIPGQVTLLSTIGFLTIGFLSISSRVDQPILALIAFTVAAISFGSFLFDVPPPKVVLGDTGAMFFGLMLGTLTIYAGGKVATAFLVLGVPIIDLFFVVVRRLLQRRSPFHGSMHGEHLHHRLLAKGWSARSVILLTALIGSSFGITALFLGTRGKIVAAGVLFLVMVGLSMYSNPKRK